MSSEVPREQEKRKGWRSRWEETRGGDGWSGMGSRGEERKEEKG